MSLLRDIHQSQHSTAVPSETTDMGYPCPTTAYRVPRNPLADRVGESATAAKGAFPYPHRNLAEVFAEERRAQIARIGELVKRKVGA
jgi:hypothetical protein